ncbi:MAG: hypothetical protein K2Y20_09005 [Sphingomonas sp.]|nr:hypothetical protein [Sphingomonas sp.]
MATSPGGYVDPNNLDVMVPTFPLNDPPLTEPLQPQAPLLSDSAPIINAAIAAVADISTPGGRIVRLPPGKIYVGSPIVLLDRVILEGAGERQTELHHLPGITTPMLQMGSGPITEGAIQNVTFWGNGLPDEDGLVFKAVGNGGMPDHGGLWYFLLHKVFINNIGRKSIFLHASGTAPDVLNQFITFSSCVIAKSLRPAGRALSAIGKVGQVYFTGHNQFDQVSMGYLAGCNVCFSREFVGPAGQPGDAYDAFGEGSTLLPGWSVVGDAAPYGCEIANLTAQNATTAIVIDRGSVNVRNCYFENNKVSVRAQNSAVVRVEDSEFRNAAGLLASDSNGMIVKNEAAIVTYGGNLTTGAMDRTYGGEFPGHYQQSKPDFVYAVRSGDVVYGEAVPGSTTKQFGIDTSANELVIGNTTDFFVNGGTASPVRLDNLRSYHGPGTTIHFMAFGLIKIMGFGNITWAEGQSGGASGTMLLRRFDTITLTRFTAAGTWTITGRSLQELTATAMPTTGYFEAGEFVRNTAVPPSTPLGGKLLFGWLRKTTGTDHNAATDWDPLFATTS